MIVASFCPKVEHRPLHFDEVDTLNQTMRQNLWQNPMIFESIITSNWPIKTNHFIYTYAQKNS